jgi:hypothetical protein
MSLSAAATPAPDSHDRHGADRRIIHCRFTTREVAEGSTEQTSHERIPGDARPRGALGRARVPDLGAAQCADLVADMLLRGLGERATRSCGPLPEAGSAK